jgi:ABC-type sugar transport system ATPase subunit
MSELRVDGVSRSFGNLRALDDVSFSLRGGEVLGIVGENGAGKSTLLNILSGTLDADQGEIKLDGEKLAPRSYSEANLNGIWRIFQEPALIPGIAVYENLLLGHERLFTRAGVLDRGRMLREARRLVAEMELDVDVREPLFHYDTATQQALEVARSSLLPELLGLPSGFVLFDEPTTGLTRSEVDRLLARMRKLREEGTGVAFISHRLEEIFEVCDRIVVLKDGRLVGEVKPADVDENDLHRMMVGRETGKDYYVQERAFDRESAAAAVLEVEQLSLEQPRDRNSHVRRFAFQDIDLTVRAGEVVGIAGVLGSGKAKFIRAVSGALKPTGGEVRLAGRRLGGGVASRKRRGLAFVSGDRKGESLIDAFTVAGNISLASGEAGPGGFSNHLGIWKRGAERKEAKQAIDSYKIKAAPGSTTGSLSGGNQQKVAIARWVRRDPQLIVIENPTAGVDVGARAEIYRLLRELTAKGAAVLYVSDDLPELIGFSDRVLVMRDGRITHEFDAAPGQKPSEHDLVAAMVAGDRRSEDAARNGGADDREPALTGGVK